MKTWRWIMAAMVAATTARAADWSALTNNADLQWTQYVHEVRVSMWEHAMATKGRGTLAWNTNWVAQPLAGTDIQDRDFWADMQQQIEVGSQAFLDHYCGDPASSGQHIRDLITGETPWNNTGNIEWYYEGETGPEPGYFYLSNWTWTTLKVATGLSSGWRRVTGTNWPADWRDYNDPAYSYGSAVTNDVLGPWLVADIRTNLNWLRYTVREYEDGSTGPWGPTDPNWFESWSCYTTNYASGGCTNLYLPGWSQSDAWTEHQANWNTMLGEPGRIEDPDILKQYIPIDADNPYTVWRKYQQTSSGTTTSLYQSARVHLDLIITNRAYNSGLLMDWLMFVYPNIVSPDGAKFDGLTWNHADAYEWDNGAGLANTAFVIFGDKEDVDPGFDPATQNVGAGAWNATWPTNALLEYNEVVKPVMCVELWNFTYRDYTVGNR